MNAKDFLEEKGYSFQGRMSVIAKPSIIAKIMDEYAREQVKNCSIPDVVEQSEQLKAFAQYLDEMHGGEDFAVNEIDNFLKSL